MLGWSLNLGFAASGTEGGTSVSSTRLGTPLLIGTGCWIAPVLAALFWWWW